MDLQDAVHSLYEELNRNGFGVPVGVDVTNQRIVVYPKTERRDIPETWEGYPVIVRVTGGIAPLGSEG